MKDGGLDLSGAKKWFSSGNRRFLQLKETFDQLRKFLPEDAAKELMSKIIIGAYGYTPLGYALHKIFNLFEKEPVKIKEHATSFREIEVGGKALKEWAKTEPDEIDGDEALEYALDLLDEHSNLMEKLKDDKFIGDAIDQYSTNPDEAQEEILSILGAIRLFEEAPKGKSEDVDKFYNEALNRNISIDTSSQDIPKEKACQIASELADLPSFYSNLGSAIVASVSGSLI